MGGKQSQDPFPGKPEEPSSTAEPGSHPTLPATEQEVVERLLSEGTISHEVGDGPLRPEVRTRLSGNNREWKYRVVVVLDGKEVEDPLGTYPTEKHFPRDLGTDGEDGRDGPTHRHEVAKHATRCHLDVWTQAHRLLPNKTPWRKYWLWMLVILVLVSAGAVIAYCLSNPDCIDRSPPPGESQPPMPPIQKPDCTQIPNHPNCPQTDPPTLPSKPSAVEAVGMVTGSKKGTYYRFGQDMAPYAEKEGLTLQIKESAGSVANIMRIDSAENAAFGIVQADVLTFIKQKPELKRVTQRLRVIFPFYLEEVHVLARKEIKTLRDLQGKRVSIGRDGSGVWLTAKNLLKILNIDIAREEHLGTEDAIDGVLSDKLDAMFYVAGKPTKVFERLTQMSESGREDDLQLLNGIHFVPITEREIFAQTYEGDGVYLGPDDYPWMKEKVPTAAVRAILVSFDFSAHHDDYYRGRCEQLGMLGRAIRDNIGALRKGGHKKWQQVDLDREVPGWRQDTCSRGSVGNKNGRSHPAGFKFR
ncbi:TAXI family TRAP transporter solute-binding subunit [Candidatus Thiosymbion oneisti]|uniref:TAXI family TRAP transporter solute-binding subunit n=1 Tax=Candidatus Thiosymbion oneisti TaxID=589554 RepID=UPI000B7D45FF|nr:TAXI family TRAP transporter solute-binding subunit [Candidatus Thiosymbion oneisti]